MAIPITKGGMRPSISPNPRPRSNLLQGAGRLPTGGLTQAPPRNGGIPGYTPGMVPPPTGKRPIGKNPIGGMPGRKNPYPSGGPVTNPLVPRRNPQLTPDLLRAMAARRLGG